MSDTPTIAERYQLAAVTSDLGLRPRSNGPAEVLMAAAWADPLGSLLYRLAGEYSAAAGDIRKAEPDDLTAHLLILMQLKSLRETKEALGRFAIALATRRGYMRDDAAVLNITGRALDVWLDRTCRKCTGRGSTGGAGAPLVVCRACGGSGNRRTHLGKDAAERWFASRLLRCMDEVTAEADRQMRRSLYREAG